MLRVGASAVDITPPVGTALDGCGGREDVSLGFEHAEHFRRTRWGGTERMAEGAVAEDEW